MPRTQDTELKNVGLKATLPRLKVLDILRSSPSRHLSAEDVYRRLLEQGSDVGLATVYRVLSQLEAAGLLSRNVFDTGKAVHTWVPAGRPPVGLVWLLPQLCGRPRERCRTRQPQHGHTHRRIKPFLGEQVLRHAVFTPYGLALDAPDGVDQPWGQHITRGAAVASPHTQNQHVVGITQRQIHVV